MERETRFKAAAVQASPVFLDKERTLEKACGLVAQAAGNGADLVVFPEAFIPTYPYWSNPGGTSAGWMGVFVQLFKNSVEIPSEDTDRLCDAARENGVFVVMGLNERDASLKGTLYNTMLFIDRKGSILGKHRKLVPTFHERLYWGRGDGSDLTVFETELGGLGGLICYEHHMSLSKYAMYAKGEQIHCAVWPGWPGGGGGFDITPIIDAACRQYAYEGQVFVIVSCAYITEDQVPDNFPLKTQTDWTSKGGSGIISPLGDYLAGPAYGEETILYADIDMDMRIAAKSIIDTVGHYARWDVTRLLVNESKYEPVESGSEAPLPAAETPALLEELRSLRAEVRMLTERVEGLEAGAPVEATAGKRKGSRSSPKKKAGR